jgi:uncharacterized repeat protein (TIGR03803 family)
MPVLWREIVSVGATATLLVACGRMQPPIGAGAIPQASSPQTQGAPWPSVVAERVLYSFAGGSDGADPQAALIAVNGEFYGTTSAGGNRGCAAGHGGCGTVYEVNSAGHERVLHSFKGGTDGSEPEASLVDTNGRLYGTTASAGGYGCKTKYERGCGTVFEMPLSGKERVLYRFRGGTQGAKPSSLLTLLNHSYYGETNAGGNGGCYRQGCGVIFKISSSGRETVVYTFKAGQDGAAPSGGLTLSRGDFYGTTTGGGSYACYWTGGCGTVFKMTPSGNESVVHVFTGNPGDGAFPESGLVLLNSSLYGTTFSGGNFNCGLTYYLPCGTVFEVGASGHEKVIYNFKGGTDGAFPNNVIAVNGDLYGTTGTGGSRGCGTIFKVTPAGQETILYEFTGGNDGCGPDSGLVDVNGTLYGTTEGGGAYADGTVYAVTP